MPRMRPAVREQQLEKAKLFDTGAIAQLGERLHGMQEVGGSIPPSSTKFYGKANTGLP